MTYLNSRSLPILALSGLLFACSQASVDQNTTATSSDSDSGTEGSTTAGATSGSTDDGSESGSAGTDSDSSSTTDATTTDPTGTDPTDATSETTDPGTDSNPGTETDTETGTATDTDTDTDTDTGGPDECTVDDDCALIDDCCSCYPYLPGDEDPPVCDDTCEQTMCEMIGVEAPVCRFGKCELPELHCDDSNLLCDALPPPCDEGTLPQVDEEEICYTGKCVPAESCDVVPSCDVCQKLEGYMCVTLVTQLGFVHSCDPIPPACMGAVSCECAGEACEEPYDLCGEGGDAELSCSCPEC